MFHLFVRFFFFRSFSVSMHLLVILYKVILDTQQIKEVKKMCKRLTKTTIGGQKKIIDYLLSGCRNGDFHEYCGLPYTILNTGE